MQNLAKVIQSNKPLHMCLLNFHFSTNAKKERGLGIYIQTGVNLNVCYMYRRNQPPPYFVHLGNMCLLYDHYFTPMDSLNLSSEKEKICIYI